MKWMVLIMTSFIGVTPWLIEYHEERKTKADAIKWCEAILGVLASPEDKACFKAGNTIWIQNQSDLDSEIQGKACTYWDGTDTSLTSCNTLLNFYCKTYASSVIRTFGSQQNLSHSLYSVQQRDQLFINLRTCTLAELTLHGNNNESQYTIRIGQQNEAGSRNIIIYRTIGSKAILLTTSMVHQKEPCERTQMYTVKWGLETANQRQLHFVKGWNVEDSDVITSTDLYQEIPQEVTVSSIGGEAVWYFYAPMFQDSTMSSEGEKLIVRTEKDGNFIAFELKTCDIGKITITSAVSTKYEYDILFDGLRDGNGRNVYIINRKTNSATAISLKADSGSCMKYRFYYVTIVDTGQSLDIHISGDLKEFVHDQLQRNGTKDTSELLMFYTITKDSRNWENDYFSNTLLGNWTFFDLRPICASDYDEKGSTVTVDYKTIDTTPFTTDNVGRTQVTPVTSTTFRSLFTERARVSNDGEDNSRKAQIIGISIGVSVVVLIGIILLIVSMVIKRRSNREGFNGRHHGRSISDIMFPGAVNLAPVNLTNVAHDGDAENVYSTCDQRQPSSSGEGLHDYLAVNGGQRSPVKSDSQVKEVR